MCFNLFTKMQTRFVYTLIMKFSLFSCSTNQQNKRMLNWFSEIILLWLYIFSSKILKLIFRSFRNSLCNLLDHIFCVRPLSQSVTEGVFRNKGYQIRQLSLPSLHHEWITVWLKTKCLVKSTFTAKIKFKLKFLSLNYG